MVFGKKKNKKYRQQQPVVVSCIKTTQDLCVVSFADACFIYFKLGSAKVDMANNCTIPSLLLKNIYRNQRWLLAEAQLETKLIKVLLAIQVFLKFVQVYELFNHLFLFPKQAYESFKHLYEQFVQMFGNSKHLFQKQKYLFPLSKHLFLE